MLCLGVINQKPEMLSEARLDQRAHPDHGTFTGHAVPHTIGSEYRMQTTDIES